MKFTPEVIEWIQRGLGRPGCDGSVACRACHYSFWPEYDEDETLKHFNHRHETFERPHISFAPRNDGREVLA